MEKLAAKTKHTAAGEDNPASAGWHVTGMRVPLFEVDLGQAVYHGNYFHLFETARGEFLRDIGYPYRRFMDQQLHLTIVEASCSYRKSLRYDDTITIYTGIPWWRRRSLAFSQQIFRVTEGEPGELCTRVELRMVCVRFSGQPTLLPEGFLNLLPEQAGVAVRGEG
jgi:acyl-CoA thioester hydrolase